MGLGTTYLSICFFLRNIIILVHFAQDAGKFYMAIPLLPKLWVYRLTQKNASVIQYSKYFSINEITEAQKHFLNRRGNGTNSPEGETENFYKLDLQGGTKARWKWSATPTTIPPSRRQKYFLHFIISLPRCNFIFNPQMPLSRVCMCTGNHSDTIYGKAKVTYISRSNESGMKWTCFFLTKVIYSILSTHGCSPNILLGLVFLTKPCYFIWYCN